MHSDAFLFGSKEEKKNKRDCGDIDNSDDSDDEIVTREEDNCCVCKKYSPPNLHTLPYLKIVNWAQCDQCNHWVHLGFCTNVKVVRKHSDF